MKARIKSTGDIMPIAPYARVTLDVCDDRGTPCEVDFEDIELINEDESVDKTDWESFHRGAAKDAMCQLIGMGRDDGYKYSPEEVAHYAIVYADSLIAKLKEK